MQSRNMWQENMTNIDEMSFHMCGFVFEVVKRRFGLFEPNAFNLKFSHCDIYKALVKHGSNFEWQDNKLIQSFFCSVLCQLSKSLSSHTSTQQLQCEQVKNLILFFSLCLFCFSVCVYGGGSLGTANGNASYVAPHSSPSPFTEVTESFTRPAASPILT